MKKAVYILIVAVSVIGLLKIFSILPFNRMAADDYSVAVMAREGIWNAVSTTFTKGNGRFVASLIQAVSVVLTGESGKVMLYISLLVAFKIKNISYCNH